MAVEVFADGDFVSAFGVGDGKGVCDLDLLKIVMGDMNIRNHKYMVTHITCYTAQEISG